MPRFPRILRFLLIFGLAGGIAPTALANPSDAPRRVATPRAQATPRPTRAPRSNTVGRASASDDVHAQLNWARQHVLTEGEHAETLAAARTPNGTPRTRASRDAVVRLQRDVRARSLLRSFGRQTTPLRFEGEAGDTAEQFGYRLGSQRVRISGTRRGVSSLRPLAARPRRSALLAEEQVAHYQAELDAGGGGTAEGRTRVAEAARRLAAHENAQAWNEAEVRVDESFAATNELTSELNWHLESFDFVTPGRELELQFSRTADGSIDLEVPGLSDYDTDRLARSVGSQGPFRRGIERRLANEPSGRVTFRVTLEPRARRPESTTATETRLVEPSTANH